MRRNSHVAAPNVSVHVPQGADWNRLYPASRTQERFNDATHANRVTSACGLEIYRDELLGKEYYGNAFTCEPVHNLVHREVLAPDGVTFRSTRATNELNREFLTSTDNWFRPVQARTGPDGALWVVDMYRYVIEHPRWIPSNRLAQLDVRAGEDKGRIYRVHRKDAAPRRIRDFTKLSILELAAALDSPNGTERDIVHRELLHRGSDSANTRLREMVSSSVRPAVRVQALSVLNTLGKVTPEHLSEGFRDTSPSVREHVLRIAGPRETLPTTLSAATRDPHMRVRYQAALSLARFEGFAEWSSPLLAEATTNHWLRAAILTSPRINSLVDGAARLPSSTGQIALTESLLSSISYRSAAELVPILGSVLPQAASNVQAWRFRAGAKLLQRYNADEHLRTARIDPELWEMQGWQYVSRAKQLARSAVTNDATGLEIRRAALLFLCQSADRKEIELVSDSLRDGDLQEAALNGLLRATAMAGWGELDERHLAGALLSSWSRYSPRQREQVAERCLAQPEGADVFLSAAEQRKISPLEVSISARNRFLKHPASGIREAAEKLWPKRTSERTRLVFDYRKAITPDASAGRGVQVFNAQCAACHALNGRGTAVGPDLAAWRDKSIEDFLVAILDPNAAIEPRYVNYIVETKKGGVFYGVIRSETATSLELVSPGIHETLLRGEVAKIEASTTSLMPEGLEQGITPGEMNDLLAFLKKPAPQPFGRASAGQIQAAQKNFAGLKPNGFAKLLFASEQLDFPSWLGPLTLLHCRQTDGKSRVTWETAAAKPEGSEVTFTVAAAMGLTSQPQGTFTLKVDGEAALDFDVALGDSAWESADGKVRMSYGVREANAEDSNGILTISLARELATGTTPVRFEVIGSAANSQRWFGIYEVRGKLQLGVEAAAR